MQRVTTRLYLLRNEWFLDLSAGVPYLQQIAVKPANRPLAASIIKQTIMATPGISSIEEFEFLFNSATRRFDVKARVLTIFGVQPLSIQL